MTHTTSTSHVRRGRRVHAVVRWGAVALVLLVGAAVWPAGAAAQVQVTAAARPGATPPWDKGIQQITPESYYNAIECGTAGGDDPPCVFWDTGLCQNDDFTLAVFTGYKQVAYEVWATVRQGQPAPEPNYQAARRTRVTIGVTPVQGSTNALTELVLTRGGNAVRAVDRSLSNGGGRYTFDYPAWAPTGAVALDLVGDSRTISCVIEPAVLQQFR